MRADRIVLDRRPRGVPVPGDFRWESRDLPTVAPGQVQLETLYLSVDPYMRGRMSERESYAAPYALGDVIAGSVLARVVATRSAQRAEGDLVLASYGWQTASVVDAADTRALPAGADPPVRALSVLGSTGLTAYLGMGAVGRPGAGETVVVSGAAGAVGLVAGQVARIQGARAVGITGSAAKCEVLTRQARYASAVNYRMDDFAEQLRAACPHGVDVYFDNVGGAVSDAVLSLINQGARIVVCGQISQNHVDTPVNRVPIPTVLLNHGALMQGFMVMRYADRYEEARRDLRAWLASGELWYRETIIDGFERTVDAFLQLFTGGNLGKMLVRVAG